MLERENSLLAPDSIYEILYQKKPVWGRDWLTLKPGLREI